MTEPESCFRPGTLQAALSLMVALILEDGRRWGEPATAWQMSAARAIFDPNPDLPPFRWESRPRGGSKTTDAAGWIIVLLMIVLRPGSETYVFASDLDQARLTRDKIRGFVQRTPELAGALTIDKYRITCTSTGSTCEIMSSDGASAFGLTGAFFLVDELCQMQPTENRKVLWEAIVSGMDKVPGAKLAVITTSGDPGSWAHDIYKHACRSELWTVSDVPGPLAWRSEKYLADQKLSRPHAWFARMHLNVWAAGSDRLTNEDDLEACVTLAGPVPPVPGRRYIISGDLGWKKDRAVLCVMHAETQLNEDGEVRSRLLVLDQIRVWTPTPGNEVQISDVKAQILDYAGQYRGAEAILDPREAVGMLQELRAEGVPAEQFIFTEASNGRLGLALLQAIRSHALAIWRDEDLIQELLTVKLIEKTVGNYKLEHDASGFNDRAIALALGALTLMERMVGRPEIIFESTTPNVALDGGPLQLLNGPYAMNPMDTFANHLEIHGDGW